MQIFVSDPIFQTHIVTALFFLALILTIRKRANPGTLSLETTQELKGFAIIAIFFAHIGYYLSSDTRFLFPLSVLAGVGVDLFLFLSAFGLTTSALSKPLTALQFYRRRLAKLFIPLWITLALFFALDFFVLHASYGALYVLRSFAGIFPHANLYQDVNSPLWYFTLILGYYLIFPFIFSRKRPYLSAIGLYAASLALTLWNPWWLWHALSLYEVHFLAFPLGMLAAWYAQGRKNLIRIPSAALNYALLVILAAVVAYFSIYSEVGKNHWLAELGSVFTAALILAFFIIKKFEIRFFYLFGIHSFEMYLLHWPILYRYDFLFKFLPAWLALALYLIFFAALGWALQQLVRRIDPTK